MVSGKIDSFDEEPSVERGFVKMQKQSGSGSANRKCCWILGVIILWWCLCIFHFSSTNFNNLRQQFAESNQVQSSLKADSSNYGSKLITNTANSFHHHVNDDDHSHVGNDFHSHAEENDHGHADVCHGKYVYIHHLPSIFNEDILAACKKLNPWRDMCQAYSNGGLGPKLVSTGWFDTDQFALELIFHNRMKQYECLTEDSNKATLVYVPFYPGLDISRNLWGADVSTRDRLPKALAQWLGSQPEWNRMGGRDHFMVCGRLTWDFRRLSEADSDWGNKLLLLEEMQNMSTMLIEKSPWHTNDYAIPYPSYFHPGSRIEVIDWQERMRRSSRPFLMSFVGTPREDVQNSIMEKVIEQCRGTKSCFLMECGTGNDCGSPQESMKVFQESVFCLHPQGDSATRRFIFDAMVGGCIPVFFHPHSAYIQYKWHLPYNHSDYSVFIPQRHVKANNLNIESVLRGIPQEHVLHMRETVIRLIPALVYANPTLGQPPDFEDAFDVTIQALIERASQLRGTNPSINM